MIAACELLVEFLSAVPSIPAAVSGENALTQWAINGPNGYGLSSEGYAPFEMRTLFVREAPTMLWMRERNG